MMTTLPHFVHIGLPKTASTWLQELFAGHPEICFVYKPKFFHWDDCFLRGKDFYLSLFKPNSASKIILDSDEQYSVGIRHGSFGWDCCYKPQHFKEFAKRAREFFLPPDRELIAKRIYQTSPSAKIIMVLRNQPDWLISRYKHYLIKGEPRSFPEFVKDKSVLASAFYSPIVDLYLKLFGRGNVLVIFYEQLIGNPEKFLNKISDFMGISGFDYGKIGGKSRVGLTNRGAKIIQKINWAAGKNSSFISKPVFYLDRKLFRRLRDINLISPEEKQALADLYAEDNQKLSELLGRSALFT